MAILDQLHKYYSTFYVTFEPELSRSLYMQQNSFTKFLSHSSCPGPHWGADGNPRPCS